MMKMCEPSVALSEQAAYGRLFNARDPLDQTEVGYLIGGRTLPPSDVLTKLVGQPRERPIIARIDSVDASLEPPSPWHVDSVWVTREPADRTGASPDGLVVEEVPTATNDGVLLMLAKAGVAGARKHMDLDHAILRVRELATNGELTGARSIVARANGSLIAHSTFRDAPDPVTGETFTELVDTYVGQSHTGRGLGSLLTNYVLAAANRRAQRVLGHVVWEGGLGLRVLESLKQDGWVQEFVLYGAT